MIGDIEEDAAQGPGDASFDCEGADFSQPDHPLVCGNHAILELAWLFLLKSLLAEVLGQKLIIRVNVAEPKTSIGAPEFSRITEQPLGLLAHERERETDRIGFPHYALD